MVGLSHAFAGLDINSRLAGPRRIVDQMASVLSGLSEVSVAEFAKVGEPDILWVSADLFQQLVHDCMVSVAISIIKGSDA